MGIDDLTFSAAVAAPEVNVQGNGLDIADGDTTPSTADGTLFASVVVGTPVTRTFTIQNTGTASLTLGTFSSTNAAFTIPNPPSGPIAIGSSVTFDVVFTPSAVGTVSSTISFVNNDTNENPYDFDVSGTGTAAAAPEVDVQGNSISIADGDTTPSAADGTLLSDSVVGFTSTRTFTILNLGTANLSFSNLASSNSLFTISGAPSSPVAPNASVTFDVVFTPTAAGNFSSTISFSNNDSDENPYDFVVSANGIAAAAEANVTGNSISIVDGDSTPGLADHTVFLPTVVNANSSRTYTIQNSGNVDLTLGAFSSSNPLFTIPSPPTGPVAPGGSVTFSVVFSPTAVGLQTSTISFSNNDADENPYNFDVSAQAVAAPVLYINEILFNPPGTDAPNEYVEIRGVPSATIPAGTYLLGIEGDVASNPGDIQTIFDLGGLTLGSNGLLVLRQATNTYVPDANATLVTATGTGFTGAANFSADGSTDIENASATFVIVHSANIPTLTSDIDGNDDGTVDGTLATNWSLLDQVGILDAATDVSYASITFEVNGVGIASGTVVNTQANAANYVARIGNSTGFADTDWVSAGLTGVAPTYAMIAAQTFPVALAGARLNHIGATNNFTPAGLTIVQSGGSTDVTEGGATDSYSIALATQPTGNVDVVLDPDDQLDLGAGTGVAVTLAFTSANWNIAQSVTVVAVDDALIEGPHTGTISQTIAASSALDYVGLTLSSICVNVSDNDVLVPAVSGPVSINGGQTQRSQLTSITIDFNTPVQLSAGAISVGNVGLFSSQSIVNLATSQLIISPASGFATSFTVTFDTLTNVGAGVVSGGVVKRANGQNSLADGTYQLQIDRTKVKNLNNVNMPATYSFGTAQADRFYRMFGDSNGDGVISGSDLTAYRLAIASYNPALDWDGNGSVSSSGIDYTSFTSNYGKRRRSL